MPRTLSVLVLVVTLVPVRPVVAGPPAGVSGKLVLDEVADGLRKYGREKDLARRAQLLQRLAPTTDPRVAVALGEAMDDPNDWMAGFAAMMLLEYYCQETPCFGLWGTVRPWWEKHQTDLRRWARLLP